MQIMVRSRLGMYVNVLAETGKLCLGL